MSADIDTQGFLLKRQKLSLREFRYIRHGDLVLLLFFLRREIKEAQLPLQYIFAVLVLLIQQFRRDHGLLPAVARQGIHGSGLDEVLQGTLIYLASAHALHEIIDGSKEPVILPLPDDLVHHVAANALDSR